MDDFIKGLGFGRPNPRLMLNGAPKPSCSEVSVDLSSGSSNAEAMLLPSFEELFAATGGETLIPLTTPDDAVTGTEMAPPACCRVALLAKELIGGELRAQCGSPGTRLGWATLLAGGLGVGLIRVDRISPAKGSQRDS
jgi:hypothetical protein